MKSETSLQRSLSASIKQALRSADTVTENLYRLDEGEHPENVMEDLRDELARLTKSIHEFNAYHNALTTS